MTSDLLAALPQLVPAAIRWAETHEAAILASGLPLTERGIEIARRVGVAQPERIRIMLVPQLPTPDDPHLRAAALQTGLLGPGMVGLTLGHGIYICEGHANPRLVSHECRHVHQYEAAGSIAAYLPVYLKQVAELGYRNAPFEIDARAHEGDA